MSFIISAMKAFNIIRSKLNMLAIYQSNRKQRFSFDSTNIAILIVFIVNVIIEIDFFLGSARTYQEFSSICYSVVTSLQNIIFYTSLVLQKERIFQLIDNLAAFTSTSSLFDFKTQSLLWKNKIISFRLIGFGASKTEKEFVEIDSEIYNFTNKIEIGFVKLSLQFSLSAHFIVCNLMYWFTDFGNEALMLPFPIEL